MSFHNYLRSKFVLLKLEARLVRVMNMTIILSFEMSSAARLFLNCL